MSLAHQIKPLGDGPAPSALAKYDAAILALSEAKSVDEVKDLRDKAEAMRAYARQAKNKDLEADAAEIRIRAERRLGELIAGQKATDGLNAGGRPQKTGSDTEPVSQKATLAEAGIDKKLSARAQKMAAVPAAEFESMVGEWRERVEVENERVTTNLLAAGEKKLSRDEKEAALADKMKAAAESLGQGKFGVILADPPWRFEPYSRQTGMDRAADNHYPTMDVDAIAALEVPASEDCALFLWATSPMIREALFVMSAWGFEYKSQLIWLKDRIGTGYWARNKHEILLIGTRGDIPAPAPGTQPESVIAATVGAHSEKPVAFHEIIERIYPNLPRLEMFARASRPGWNGWGAEAKDHSVARNGANMENGDVDGSAPRAGHAGQTVYALSGQVESRNSDVDTFDGNASLAAREGEKSLHSNSPAMASEAGRFNSGSLTEIVVKTQVQVLPGVAFGDAKGGPTGMGRSDSVERHAPNSNSSATSSRQTDTAGMEPPPSVSATIRKPLRPHCLKPELCAGSGREHCHACKRAMGTRADGGDDITTKHEAIQA